MQPDCLTLSAKTLVPIILLTYTLLICFEMLASKMMRKGLYDFDDTLHNLIMFFVNRFFLHTQLIPKLGFLEGLVNTPDAHRIHHGNKQIQFESNLGGVLMIWDQIFCSYMSDSEKLVYGIKGIKPENNFFVAQISPFVRYFKRHFKKGFTKFRI